MQKHTRNYMDHFGYGEQDYIGCEICGSKAVDIHHIFGRGKDMDEVWNLMALCRKCHDKAHKHGASYKATLANIHKLKFSEKSNN